jgi:hypothetical protein
MIFQSRGGVALVTLIVLALLTFAPSLFADDESLEGYRLPPLDYGTWHGHPDHHDLLMNVKVGFEQVNVGHRWFPVRVTPFSLSGRGYSGRIVVTALSNGAENSFESEFAIQPRGGANQKEALEHQFVGVTLNQLEGFARHAIRLEISIYGTELGQGGRERLLQRQSIDWNQLLVTSGENVLPAVLSVGATGLELYSQSSVSHNALFRLPSQLRGHESGHRPRLMAVVSQDVVGALPAPESKSMLYDSVTAAVLGRDALDGLTVAQARTLKRWAEGGGHVVMLSHRTDPDPAGLLPPDVVSVQLGGHVGEAPQSEGDAPSRAVIVVTARGAKLGWNALDLPGLPAGGIVTGPVGLGWITVVGDPLPTIDDESGATHDAIWSAVLGLLGPDESSIDGNDPDAAPIAYGSARVPNEILTEWLVGDLEVPQTSRLALLLMILGVGLLVGLGVTVADWFILGTPYRRRYSLFTAMAWIALASIAALVLPMLLPRGAPCGLLYQMVDLNQSDEIAATSSIVGMKAARLTRLTPWSESPQSWVYTLPSSIAGQILGKKLDSVQIAGNVLRGIHARPWTVHLTTSQQPAVQASALPDGTAMRAELLPAASGGQPTLRISGLCSGLTIDRVSVVTCRPSGDAPRLPRRGQLRLLRSSALSHRVGDGGIDLPLELSWVSSEFDSVFMNEANPAALDGPIGAAGMVARMPSIESRAHDILRHLSTGRFALVVVDVSTVGSERELAAGGMEGPWNLGLLGNGTWTVRRTIRCLVPIDETMRETLLRMHDRWDNHEQVGTP